MGVENVCVCAVARNVYVGVCMRVRIHVFAYACIYGCGSLPCNPWLCIDSLWRDIDRKKKIRYSDGDFFGRVHNKDAVEHESSLGWNTRCIPHLVHNDGFACEQDQISNVTKQIGAACIQVFLSTSRNTCVYVYVCVCVCVCVCVVKVLVH